MKHKLKASEAFKNCPAIPTMKPKSIRSELGQILVELDDDNLPATIDSIIELFLKEIDRMKRHADDLYASNEDNNKRIERNVVLREVIDRFKGEAL